MIKNSIYQPAEVIIVISEYSKNKMIIKSDDNIKYFFYYKKGIHNQAENRNTGIKYSKCKYISFFDSDDFMSRFRIEIIYKILEKYSNIDIVLHSYTKSIKKVYNGYNARNLDKIAYNYTPLDIYNSYANNINPVIKRMWCCRYLNIRLPIHNAWLSGKASVLKNNHYNESWSYYRSEDTELNYRLIMKRYNYMLLKYNLGLYIPHSKCKELYS